MVNSGVTDDNSIDWGKILDNIPDDFHFDFLDGFVSSLSIDDIEQCLLNDDSYSNHHNPLADEFFSPHGSLLGSDLSKEFSTSPDSIVVGPEEEEKQNEDNSHDKVGMLINQNKGDDVGEKDDSVDKKRKRQIRNRDAAVRSRERKKVYVRDLELKSKYYEAECKRLGTLLQCCLSENQALRLSLHSSKAFDASMTKQESAVLLLESLLLGSLLGFLGIIYLVILPSQFLSNLENAWESMAPRKEGMEEVHRTRAFHSFMMGRECKASRSRMRLTSSSTPVVILC